MGGVVLYSTPPTHQTAGHCEGEGSTPLLTRPWWMNGYEAGDAAKLMYSRVGPRQSAAGIRHLVSLAASNASLDPFLPTVYPKGHVLTAIFAIGQAHLRTEVTSYS